jgi:hypothetical protein
VENTRASILKLDCVYGGNPSPPRKGQFLALSDATKTNKGLPKGKEFKDNDLKRGLPSKEARRDRVAQIADRRNDQNLIISQLHVAFLRAHNYIANQGGSFEKAQAELIKHYHWLIVHDYLRRIADTRIVDEVLAGADRIYDPPPGEFYLPLEFTVAAFRFGHSMIRSKYYLNNNVISAMLGDLYTLTALSNNGQTVATPYFGWPTLPDYKIIHWREYLPGGQNVARRIDTRLVEPLSTVLDETEQPVPCERRLAVQDLKRGYIMRIPTGQAVARALKPRVHAVDIQVLSPAEILEVAEKTNTEQKKALEESGFLLERTPLWFYILAEAARGGGKRLGPVGSRLVAEVIIGLIRRVKTSFLNDKTWKPNLPSATQGDFTIQDLLNLAGVLEP